MLSFFHNYSMLSFFHNSSLGGAVAALLLGACMAGCGGSSAPEPPGTVARLSPAAAVGAQIFSDAGLSASGKQSCASCHDPASAHAQPNLLAAQLGGADGTVAGFRATPSLRYLSATPAFAFDQDGAPSGGFDRDGRARSLADQAMRPFLAPHEMANASKEELVGRLKGASYAAQFRLVFGAAILDDPEQAFDRVAFALQQFQKEDPAFHPFDSLYDQFLAGKAQLQPAQLRGLALFNDAAKGNCSACHTSARGADGAAPLFTDFSFDNLGVPRNARIAATADPRYVDLGLCGPDRSDLAARADLCGAFKVPTLRNVATRKVFFHNGVFTTLKDVVGFYARRDTNPEEWYPRAADGTVLKFDDLPAAYHANVNRSEGPYNRQAGMAPALSSGEIDDLIQFLGTLNDADQPQPAF